LEIDEKDPKIILIPLYFLQIIKNTTGKEIFKPFYSPLLEHHQ
jgi:hypothetical protein